jgi:peptidoglycan/xylan/chitin deacetylase (PgdA/CDA1 family)
MWDVVGGDFDPNCSKKQLIDNIINNVEEGSIIVLHDNQIVKNKTLKALPLIIEGIQKKGFQLNAIPFTPLR